MKTRTSVNFTCLTAIFPFFALKKKSLKEKKKPNQTQNKQTKKPSDQ